MGLIGKFFYDTFSFIGGLVFPVPADHLLLQQRQREEQLQNQNTSTQATQNEPVAAVPQAEATQQDNLQETKQTTQEPHEKSFPSLVNPLKKRVIEIDSEADEQTIIKQFITIIDQKKRSSISTISTKQETPTEEKRPRLTSDQIRKMSKQEAALYLRTSTSCPHFKPKKLVTRNSYYKTETPSQGTQPKQISGVDSYSQMLKNQDMALQHLSKFFSGDSTLLSGTSKPLPLLSSSSSEETPIPLGPKKDRMSDFGGKRPSNATMEKRRKRIEHVKPIRGIREDKEEKVENKIARIHKETQRKKTTSDFTLPTDKNQIHDGLIKDYFQSINEPSMKRINTEKKINPTPQMSSTFDMKDHINNRFNFEIPKQVVAEVNTEKGEEKKNVIREENLGNTHLYFAPIPIPQSRKDPIKDDEKKSDQPIVNLTPVAQVNTTPNVPSFDFRNVFNTVAEKPKEDVTVENTQNLKQIDMLNTNLIGFGTVPPNAETKESAMQQVTDVKPNVIEEKHDTPVEIKPMITTPNTTTNTFSDFTGFGFNRPMAEMEKKEPFHLEKPVQVSKEQVETKKTTNTSFTFPPTEIKKRGLEMEKSPEEHVQEEVKAVEDKKEENKRESTATQPFAGFFKGFDSLTDGKEGLPTGFKFEGFGNVGSLATETPKVGEKEQEKQTHEVVSPPIQPLQMSTTPSTSTTTTTTDFKGFEGFNFGNTTHETNKGETTSTGNNTFDGMFNTTPVTPITPATSEQQIQTTVSINTTPEGVTNTPPVFSTTDNQMTQTNGTQNAPMVPTPSNNMATDVKIEAKEPSKVEPTKQDEAIVIPQTTPQTNIEPTPIPQLVLPIENKAVTTTPIEQPKNDQPIPIPPVNPTIAPTVAPPAMFTPPTPFVGFDNKTPASNDLFAFNLTPQTSTIIATQPGAPTNLNGTQAMTPSTPSTGFASAFGFGDKTQPPPFTPQNTSTTVAQPLLSNSTSGTSAASTGTLFGDLSIKMQNVDFNANTKPNNGNGTTLFDFGNQTNTPSQFGIGRPTIQNDFTGFASAFCPNATDNSANTSFGFGTIGQSLQQPSSPNLQSQSNFFGMGQVQGPAGTFDFKSEMEKAFAQDGSSFTCVSDKHKHKQK
ncbi:hypothetical protein EIN_498280 [Entamoeba invadens IP1]|uniref:Uncharacterized protein n=1 Tax=Entamoeba invadens IP1 TaxID=370355 RepID=A0A0A1UH41_ENTIV|nr:hypothetical protein EIN_498280 [Entamoeba invadens IP1]ELP94628.1 hypothetical protein EIN_498280 [Entamoeba invadens IP1]|eukprot:XP_004261399.1 hypothetical protein EIN_498280 [Entamoeba invadens IP1]